MNKNSHATIKIINNKNWSIKFIKWKYRLRKDY